MEETLEIESYLWWRKERASKSKFDLLAKNDDLFLKIDPTKTASSLLSLINFTATSLPLNKHLPPFRTGYNLIPQTRKQHLA